MPRQLRYPRVRKIDAPTLAEWLIFTAACAALIGFDIHGPAGKWHAAISWTAGVAAGMELFPSAIIVGAFLAALAGLPCRPHFRNVVPLRRAVSQPSTRHALRLPALDARGVIPGS